MNQPPLLYTIPILVRGEIPVAREAFHAMRGERACDGRDGRSRWMGGKEGREEEDREGGREKGEGGRVGPGWANTSSSKIPPSSITVLTLDHK